MTHTVLWGAGTGAATAGDNGRATAPVIAVRGLLCTTMSFNPWLSLDALLDAGVLTAALASWPGSVH